MDYYILGTTCSSSDFHIIEVESEIIDSDIILEGIPLDNHISDIKVSFQNASGEKNDFIVYASYFPIVSEKAKAIFQSLEIDGKYLEFIKIKFFKDKIKESYWYMNILDNIDAIDRKKSEYTVWPEFMGAKAGKIDTMVKPVLDHSKIGDRNIFRLLELEVDIIISDKLVEILNEHELTGFEALPLDKLT